MLLLPLNHLFLMQDLLRLGQIEVHLDHLLIKQVDRLDLLLVTGQESPLLLPRLVTGHELLLPVREDLGVVQQGQLHDQQRHPLSRQCLWKSNLQKLRR